MAIRKPTMDDVRLAGMAGMVGGMPLVQSMFEVNAHQEVLSQNGQQKVRLPTQTDNVSRKALEVAGVHFIEPVKGDDLFWEATIPPGWGFKRTEHYMYHDLCDEQGRKRANQVYKPDFHDRSATMYAVPRYNAFWIRDDFGESDPMIPVIQDSNGKVLWRGKPIPYTGRSEEATGAAALVLAEVCREYATIDGQIDHLKLRASKTLWGSPIRAEFDAAIDVLRIKRLCQYWDRPPITFPKSLSKVAPGDVYSLHVDIYRDGRHVDSGSSSTRRCLNDKEAEGKFDKVIDGYLESYDEVRFVIRQDSREVAKGSRVAPRTTSIDNFDIISLNRNYRKRRRTNGDR